MTIDLDEMAEAFHARMKHRFGNVTDWEDAYQEGLVRAWTDIEAGEEIFGKVLTSAYNYARSALFKADHLPLGAPHRERTGIARKQGDKTRERIGKYVEAFITEHGREPTNREIGAALKLNASGISRHRKFMREQNNGLLTREQSGNRIDRKKYRTFRIDFDRDSEETKGGIDMEIVSRTVDPSFEDDLLSAMTFDQMISGLSLEHKTVLTLKHKFDWTDQEISEQYYHHTIHARSYGNRKVKEAEAAFKELREQHADSDA